MRYLILVVCLWFISCADTPTPIVLLDRLPSWNDGNTKEEIIQFIDKITNESSAEYVEVADRIAVFDNDGTLWAEKPFYFQLFFALYYVEKMAPDHPEWNEIQPFKAVLEKDMETLEAMGEKEILELIMASHTGVTVDKFQANVMDWLYSTTHPRFDRAFSQLVYQPMLELINYLKDNDFKVFIVSGGGVDFMRPWAEDVYGIPRHQIIGSALKSDYVVIDGKPSIIKMPGIEFIDDKEGKPVAISRFIGRKPIFCVGNSDGDLQMMQFTESNKSSFMLYLHHTDSVREWAYDRDSHVGRFDKALTEANAKGWTIIDMAEDWKYVFPHDLE